MPPGPRNPSANTPAHHPPTQLALGEGTEASSEFGQPPGQTRLHGTLERVVYQNPGTQWTVARLAPRDTQAGDTAARDDNGEITVVGVLTDVYEGMPVELWGNWETSSQYGRQFKVRSCQPVLPETLLGLERYLGSKQFPGVGPELAKRVVAHFGHDTRGVLDTHPQRLVEVDGIGVTRAAAIAEAWNEQRDKREVKIFLHSYGVTDAYCERIYKKYGRDAVTLIRANPYRLALEIWGIGFKTADTIARNLGLEMTAPERLEAGIVHALGQLADDGHVVVPELNLLETAAEMLAVSIALLPPALDALEQSQLIVRESLGDLGPCVSLLAMYECESDAALALAELASTPMRPMKVDAAAVIAAFERDAAIELARAQRQAIEAAILDKCVVITGGPGVGKTTIVRAIVTILAGQQRRMALAAPTGRAAKRLSESTGVDAVTLHRLLEFQPRLGGFQRNAQEPLEVDAVIVDEVSMVDIALFRALLVALPPAAQLILVGDVDQLPSVGPGSVLADVIGSGAATVVRLTEIFRQAAESRIITAAHQVNQGVVPELGTPAGGDSAPMDFYFISRPEPEQARDTIVELVVERIPKAFGFSPLRDIQVLCPMHKGVLGTTALNTLLQERLNPGGTGVQEVVRSDITFRAGDKVMQVKNDYERSVFNGDIGVIQDIAGEDNKLIVDFNDGRVAVYKRDELDQLVHAYAVSVHKSQGSEYPAVVLALATQHYVMLRRNLLYTAITRGKRLVVIVGAPRAVVLATRDQRTTERWTWLAERIRAVLENGD